MKKMKRMLAMMLAVAMVLGLVPNSVVQAAETEIAPVEATEYPQLYVNQTASAEVGVGEQAYFQFVPEEDGYYNFKSSQDENKDTYGYLYNSDMEVIDSNDDGGGNGQFSLSMLMTAGETYYIGARFYSSGNTGTISVSATKTPLADTFTIKTEVVNFYPMMERSFTAEFPEGTVSESVSWTSSNPEVMTISYYGYAKALTPGTTTITAVSEISNITVSKDVTVYEPIEMVVETDYHLEGDVTYTFAPTETAIPAPKRSQSSAAVAAAPDSFISATTTYAPSAAICSAIPFPNPCALPVTIAILPSSLRVLFPPALTLER